MSKSWDSSILKKLKALTGKGLSTSEIGKRLGISKNAVVGKLHRLGWNVKAGGASGEETKSKSATKSTASKSASVKKTAAKKVEKVTVKKAAGVGGKKTATTTIKTATEEKKKSTGAKKGTNVHQRIVQHALEMMDLKPGQCRWPIGDPDSDDFHFCGKQAFSGKPYCYEHCRQAYQFAAPKKKN